MKSFVFFSGSGCLLPLLIILNLFFGRLFLKPLAWLWLEILLILLFLFNGYIIRRKFRSMGSISRKKAIDVEGKVVEDERQ